MSRNRNLVFLFPLIWKPLGADFARKFERLSEHCTGHIFILSSARCRNQAIGSFRLHAERIGVGSIALLCRKIWAQAVLPIWTLWGRRRVDAIIAYDPYWSGAFGVLLKVMFRTKLIVEMNGDYHRPPLRGERSEQGLKHWLKGLVRDRVVRAADAIKVLNRDQKRFLRSAYPLKRVYRFPNFVVSTWFQSLSCSQGDYLLSVGAPFYRKGVDVLINAFKSIRERHPAIRLKIMGHCPPGDLRAYQELAEHDSRIEFVKPGWIEEVGEQMRGCYALVNAARSEAMGRVHVEAMACRKPIVATRTSGGTECVEHGRTGWLCEVESVEDLAQKLDGLLSDPARAARMGEAGFERLQQEFSEDRYCTAFMQMVDEVAGAARPAQLEHDPGSADDPSRLQRAHLTGVGRSR